MVRFAIKEIKSGWAVVEIDMQAHSVKCTFEYTPTDGFSDLLRSAISAANGLNSIVCFPCHPDGTALLTVTLHGSDACQVSISPPMHYAAAKRYIGQFSEAKLPNAARAIVPVKQYVRAVLRMFDNYIYTKSGDEYEREWCCKYPSKEIEALRSLLSVL